MLVLEPCNSRPLPPAEASQPTQEESNGGRRLNPDILRNDGLNMDEKRLGDVIDDHCIKCRRVTNHAIVSLVDGQAAKVRCRTCYHDHDYRHEQAPPSKKELKKAEADAAAAAAAADGATPAHADSEKAASG